MPNFSENSITHDPVSHSEVNREEIEVRTIEPDEIETPRDWIDDEGRAIKGLLSMRTFITEEEAKAIVAGRQPGWVSPPIGAIQGFATACERRKSERRPDLPESLWLAGEFEATDRNGVVTEAVWLILPRAAGELVERSLKGNDMARVDADVAIEALKGMIPYTYNVTFYGRSRSAEAKALMRELRERRKARLEARSLKALPGQDATLHLT